MKKIYLAIATFAISSVALAQPREPRERYAPVTPEAGDYGLSIDATPVLDYFGKIFSNLGSPTPNWNYTGTNQTIVGKYFADENTAYRGLVRIGFNSKSTVVNTPQAHAPAVAFPGTPTTVEDRMKENSNFFGIGVGLEKRRGKGRLFGIYGADFMVFTAGESNKYKYGNALNPSNDPNIIVTPGANSHNFGNNIDAGGMGRVLVSKQGQGIGLGLRAFVGVEFFVANKISLGGEFGWGLGFFASGKAKTSTEAIGGPASASTIGSVGTVETVGGRNSEFFIDNNNHNFGGASGQLRLNFYF